MAEIHYFENLKYRHRGAVNTWVEHAAVASYVHIASHAPVRPA